MINFCCFIITWFQVLLRGGHDTPTPRNWWYEYTTFDLTPNTSSPCRLSKGQGWVYIHWLLAIQHLKQVSSGSVSESNHSDCQQVPSRSFVAYWVSRFSGQVWCWLQTAVVSARAFGMAMSGRADIKRPLAWPCPAENGCARPPFDVSAARHVRAESQLRCVTEFGDYELDLNPKSLCNIVYLGR